MTKKIELELSNKEFEDLGVIVTLAFDQFDFHGDLIPMEIPLKKLAKALELDKSYYEDEV